MVKSFIFLKVESIGFLADLEHDERVVFSLPFFIGGLFLEKKCQLFKN